MTKSILPPVCTPDEFAENYGFSTRRIRKLVRDHGIGRVSGNRVALEPEHVDQLRILTEAQPCRSKSTSVPLASIELEARTTASQSIEALKLAAQLKQQRSKTSGRRKSSTSTSSESTKKKRTQQPLPKLRLAT